MRVAIVCALVACTSASGSDAPAHPTITIYGAAWCAACRVFERDTLGDPNVRRELVRFTVRRVDLTDDDAPGRRAAVQVLPTIVLADDRGERERLAGAASASDFLVALRRVR